MENLKNIRMSHGYTQYQVAQELELPMTTYASWEQSKSFPSESMLIKLADYFNCSVDYLVGHQSANTLHLDGMTDDQKQLISIVQKLDARQTAFEIGRAHV